MTDTPEEPRLPPSLRLLKALVILLMITMIVGVITVVGLLVTRMPDGKAQSLAPPVLAPPVLGLPAMIQLPAGVEAEAVTFGQGWIGVVSRDKRFLLFDSKGQLLQEISLALP